MHALSQLATGGLTKYDAVGTNRVAYSLRELQDAATVFPGGIAIAAETHQAVHHAMAPAKVRSFARLTA